MRWYGYDRKEYPPFQRDFNHPLDPLELTTRQLKNCLQNHPDCIRTSEKPHQPPRRVIAIGPDRIFLRERVSSHEMVPYACLSYCWGLPHLNLKTLSETLPRFCEEIPWDLIPKTIQDAISVCRQLDIEYLWVDALCIIQDDENDRNDQIARMGAIFEHCLVTICADSAESAVAGFIPENASEIKYTSTDPDWSYFVAKDKEILRRRPLKDRGWAFQERELAPRLIQFGYTHVKYRCGTDFAGWSEKPNETWRSLVHKYSTRKLTYESDRLLALAAIAEKMQSFRPNEKYFAGIWSDNLLEDLAWHTTQMANRDRPVAPKTRAPSWSWASTNGTVEWCGTSQIRNDRMPKLQVHYRPIGAPFLGRYTEGLLEFEGQTLSAIWDIVEFRINIAIPGVNISDHLHKFPDYKIDQVEKDIRQTILLCYFGIFDGSGWLPDFIHDWQHAFLVLKRCPRDLSMYERVGMVTVHCSNASSYWDQLENIFVHQKVFIL
jgi:hypothetical protein